MGHLRDLGKDKPNRWKARYRGPDGKERTKNFARQVDAERFHAEVEVAKGRGQWTDPRKAKVPFATFASEFLEAKKLSIRPATQSKYESALKHLVASSAPRRSARLLDQMFRPSSARCREGTRRQLSASLTRCSTW